MFVLRFAPSPNGRLHAGHALSALLNFELATQWGGRFLVRLEDIDSTRCTPELARQCLEDLSWLGISWEQSVRIQSEHFADYAKALEDLKSRGLIYPCFCSRKDIAEASEARDPDGAPIYPGICRNLKQETAERRIAAGEPHAWRLDMQKALTEKPGPHRYRRFSPQDMKEMEITADPARWGDAILARKETPTSYHLSVVVDDALQAVTHVVRGMDLEAATDLHVILQSLLGLPTPLYHHHELLTLPSGEKLSKSKGAQTLADLRENGVSQAKLLEMLKNSEAFATR